MPNSEHWSRYPLAVRFGSLVVAAGVLAAATVGISTQNTTPVAAVVKAFPGAEGYGANALGGRGGTVCKVTNLSDSGAGSLRACVSATGPRLVIFRTGGTISLNTRLDVQNPFITIAGQTAPGDGITLRMNPSSGTDQGTMRVATHDVVIRYIRFRPGNGGAADDSHDALQAYEAGGDVYNVVLDHNSFSWAIDENLNTYYDVRDITVSNNVISEALSNAGHPDGEHSKGFLAGGGSTNTSVFRNLIVSNVDRQAQSSGVVNYDMRNNVIYNYGAGAGGGTQLLSSSKGKPVMNWVNNYYKPGPSSSAARPEFATYAGDTGNTHQWYGSGNMRWTASGMQPARVAAGAYGLKTTELSMAPVTTVGAAQAYTEVVANAGASLVRDAVDKRLADDVKNGTGKIINSPSDVGGWPTLSAGTPPADTDGDGMPNAFETQHGTNPAVADAGGDVNGNGYNNVEDWFNGLIGAVPSNPAPLPTATATANVTTSVPSPTVTATTATPKPTVTTTTASPTATATATSPAATAIVCPLVAIGDPGDPLTCHFE